MNRTNYSTQKPENVLKRVNELINSSITKNAEKEKRFAVEQLHQVIVNGRKKVFQKIYEPIMKRHLELCVDLKDHRTAKDGLHQYRNMTLMVDPNSLEAVIYHLMELAEQRAAFARQKADTVSLAAAAKISDLDQEETPESIMLSSMTEEGAKDRTDRQVVLPSLRFLWETYRAILELLNRCPKLDRVYHKTCEKAFKFCQEYHRVIEFRRLCETLRSHLGSLQRMTLQPARPGRTVFAWTPENIELQLQTRFYQLEVATNLELWNEGFRTVEDIYSVIQINKKQPKSRLMAIYYEKLTRIFWVSGNYLFHAYTSYRYYVLCCECRKEMKPSEKSYQAACVLLSALAIPIIKDTEAVSAPTTAGNTNVLSSALRDDANIKAEKNRQMAMLLDFQSNPTRQALLQEIVAKGVLNEVPAEVANLYHLMESKFHPLSFVGELMPVLSYLKNSPAVEHTFSTASFSMYTAPLERVAVLQTMEQLSRVYNTVRLSFIKKLFAPLDLSGCEVEKLLVDGVARSQLCLRIDHVAGCVRFTTTAAASVAVDNSVCQFGQAMANVVAMISSKSTADDAAALRKAYMTTVANAVDAERLACVDRKLAIERRKEGLERRQAERLRQEEERKKLDEDKRKAADADRLVKEEKDRQEAKRIKALDMLNILKIQKGIEAVNGEIVDEATLSSLSESSRQAMLTNAQKEAAKVKEEEHRLMVEKSKRVDHVTRAIRIEERDAISRKFAALLVSDRAAHDEKCAQVHKIEREQWEAAVKEKKATAHLQPHRAVFENMFIPKQMEDFNRVQKEERTSLEMEFFERKIATARRLRYEEQEREYEEAEMAAQQQREDEEQEELENERKRVAAMRVSDAPRESDREPNFRDERVDRRDDRSYDRDGDEGGWSRSGPPARSNGPRDGGRSFGFSDGPRDGPRDRDGPPSNEGDEWSRVSSKADRSPAPPAAGGSGINWDRRTFSRNTAPPTPPPANNKSNDGEGVWRKV